MKNRISPAGRPLGAIKILDGLFIGDDFASKVFVCFINIKGLEIYTNE